jgi:indole-3-glycerol phosphate synthase
MIGINNRDLHTFTVDLETSIQLAALVPEGVLIVAESGIRTREDAERLAAAGVHAMLVGERLVTSRDVPAVVRQLVSVRKATGP